MAFTLPALPYTTAALAAKGMCQETLELHHGKHHQAYVTALNGFVEKDAALQGKSLDEIVKLVNGDAAKAPPKKGFPLQVQLEEPRDLEPDAGWHPANVQHFPEVVELVRGVGGLVRGEEIKQPAGSGLGDPETVGDRLTNRSFVFGDVPHRLAALRCKDKQFRADRHWLQRWIFGHGLDSQRKVSRIADLHHRWRPDSSANRAACCPGTSPDGRITVLLLDRVVGVSNNFQLIFHTRPFHHGLVHVSVRMKLARQAVIRRLGFVE